MADFDENASVEEPEEAEPEEAAEAPPEEEDDEEEGRDDDNENDDLGEPPANLEMGLGEPPDLGDAAEIVVIGTSLGSIKRQFFSSKRVQHFLDCKGVVYFLIDCNRDLSSAMNLKDTELFKEWKSLGILRTIENPNNENAEPEVVIPQVLVDGVVLGGEADLQELEEDGDLDWIFAGAACPCCLHEKPPEASSCASCSAVFTSLIPSEVQAAGQVQQILQGYAYNDTEDKKNIHNDNNNDINDNTSGGAGTGKERYWASGLQQADFEWEGEKRQEDEEEHSS